MVQVNDTNPSEVEAVVHCLRPFKSVRHTHLCVDHFKQWIQEAYSGDNLKTPPSTAQWMCLIDILQHMWRMGEIHQELGWTLLVLIPKGSTYTR